MSYRSNINDNVLLDLNKSHIRNFFNTLGETDWLIPIASHNNVEVHTDDGKTHYIKNTNAFEQVYNLYDLIASAKQMGYSNADIALALDASIPKEGGANWTNNDVKALNAGTTKATEGIQRYLNANYSELNPYVSVLLDPNGNNYITRVVYTDPRTGKLVYKRIEDLDHNKVPDDKSLNSLFASDKALGAELTTAKNLQAQVDLANKAGAALDANPTLGSNAKTNYDLTQVQKDSVTAKAPGTDNLEAWNQSNKYNVIETVGNNMKSADSSAEVIERKSLKDLQALTSAINAENINTTDRNINKQRLDLLDQVRNDPELYQAITSQLRADAAQGTIAGQRAANIGAQAQAADQNYDTSAAELYKNLFTGDSAVAGTTRQNILSGRASTLDQYIQGQLSKGAKMGSDALVQSQNISTALQSLKEMAGIDAAKFDDLMAEAHAAAKGNAEKLSSDLDGKVKVDTAKQDTALTEFMNTLGLGEDYLNKGASSNTDVTDAVKVIIDALSGSSKTDTMLDRLAGIDSSTSGYKKLDRPEYTEAELFDNPEYNAAINNPVIQSYLDNMKELTSYKDLSTLKSELDLDMLDEAGMAALYEGYTKEANKESDRVFNKAQRAYIAAITAGDAKTADQLSRLAVSTGGAKGNLYKMSALTNNYNQQRNGSTTGRQLATDFQNQQAANLAAIAKSGLDANSALTKYLGTGTDSYGTPTLYGIGNTYDKATASIQDAFSQYGNKKAEVTQKLNTSKVNGNIANFDRLNSLINEYDKANVAGAVNNIGNTGTRNTLKTQIDAMKAQSTKK